MRTRRRKLTATQLMTQNQSEEIIDKDNHARDAMKYVVMSLPEPTEKNRQDEITEKIANDWRIKFDRFNREYASRLRGWSGFWNRCP